MAFLCGWTGGQHHSQLELSSLGLLIVPTWGSEHPMNTPPG